MRKRPASPNSAYTGRGFPMRAYANQSLKNVFLIVLAVLTLGLGSGLFARGVMDGEEPMEDMCAGDMVWMIGWCLDMVMPGDSVEVASLALSSDAQRDDGPFEPINVPGAVGTRAFGINPQGDIVGSYTAAGRTHGFLLSDGAFTTIDYPGAASTEAWGINARGDIIGRYTVAGRDGTLGFLLLKGKFTDISLPNPSRPDGKHLVTLPTKIGSSGEIVGCYHNINGMVDMFGYVQRGDSVDTFGLASSLGGSAVGVSAMHNGVTPGGTTIVGLTFPVAGQSRGYIVSNGVVSYLDYPGSAFTQAWDVNPVGTIVGQYAGGGRTHGFYLDASGYVSLDVPNSSMTVARGVNPRGEIVGMYNDAAGAHGFVIRR
jgi:probable HAF family extracellular repeat protein